MSKRGGINRPPAGKGTIAEQQTRALRLSAQGWTYEEIATELGISDSTAHRRVEAACKAMVAPALEDWRKIQGSTLAQALRVAMGIMGGTDPELRLKAADRVVRITERIAKLNGLDAPTQVDVSGTVHEVTQADLELAELLRQMSGEVVSTTSEPVE